MVEVVEVRSDGGGDDAQSTAAKQALQAAQRALQSADYATAASALDTLVDLRPDDWAAYAMRAEALLHLRRHADCALDCRFALALLAVAADGPVAKVDQLRAMLSEAVRQCDTVDWWDIDVRLVPATGEHRMPENAVKCKVNVIGAPTATRVAQAEQPAKSNEEVVANDNVSLASTSVAQASSANTEETRVGVASDEPVNSVQLVAVADDARLLAQLLKRLSDDRFNAVIMSVLDTDFLDAAIRSTRCLETGAALRVLRQLTECERFDIAFLLADQQSIDDWKDIVRKRKADGDGDICDKILEDWSQL